MSPMGGEGALSSPKGITARDRFDTMRSDLIFCNLMGMDKISVGSMIEFGWADAMRIPILLVAEEGNIHEHAMVNDMISFRAYSLKEGLDIARHVLIPEEI
jgi:nucleoside 2-deoxyribosyltransferase